jgi:23S rRNA pseudouridine1911/1915/1917 synthase
MHRINAKLRHMLEPVHRQKIERMGSDETEPAEADAGHYSAQFERRVPADLAGLRFDQALARMFPEHSRSRLQAWVRSGRITLDSTGVDVKRKVWGGEHVRIVPVADRDAAESASLRAEAIPLHVVHEDDALLVVDKPAGLVVHPGSGNWTGTLLNAILHHAPQCATLARAGIVHRLDKDTSGLLVIAKSDAAQTDLVRQLQARTIGREYLALVHGVLRADGAVDAPIGRHPVERTRMAVAARGRPALTHYSVLREFSGATLVKCRLETGRTHQIRVHMRSIGHPIVGDPVYGNRSARRDGLPVFRRQALHAARLALVHPVTGKSVAWESPLPDDMRELLGALG